MKRLIFLCCLLALALARVRQANVTNPLDQFNIKLHAFHFYADDMKMQMPVFHYCSILSSELIQCILFNSSDSNALLMGVEYVVPRTVFETYSGKERLHWHSHVYEILKGLLTAPDATLDEELAIMKSVFGTYGKAYHTADNVNGILGTPKLTMSFLADGQLDPNLIRERDAMFGFNVDDKIQSRIDANFTEIPIAAGADAWHYGRVMQTKLVDVTFDDD